MAIGKAKEEFKFYVDSRSTITWLYCKLPHDTNNFQLHVRLLLYSKYLINTIYNHNAMCFLATMVMDCINKGNFQPYFWSQ
jgi:hypothetical protein